MGANLEHAYLRDANLEHAYLRDANLELANLRGAKLSLDSIDLSGAIGWKEARWDEDVYQELLKRFGGEGEKK